MRWFRRRVVEAEVVVLAAPLKDWGVLVDRRTGLTLRSAPGVPVLDVSSVDVTSEESVEALRGQVAELFGVPADLVPLPEPFRLPDDDAEDDGSGVPAAEAGVGGGVGEWGVRSPDDDREAEESGEAGSDEWKDWL